jgi:hypothetical protein
MNNFLKLKLNDPGFNMNDYEEIIERNNEWIPDKTLLIDTALLEKINGSYFYIKEEYPYPYKLTDHIEIAKAIREKDTTVTFVQIFPHYDQLNRGGTFEGTSGGGMDEFTQEIYYAHLVIDAATLIPIGFARNMDMVINKRSFKQYYRFIDENNFNLNNLTR